MQKSELFPAVEDIRFAYADPDEITAGMLSIFTSLTGRTLAPADPIRRFIDCVVLIIVQLRSLIDKAAKMNLLAYAYGPFLDMIGTLMGVSRLGASSAASVIRFTLSQPLGRDAVIPAGTRITADGEIFFATDEELAIPAGSLSGDVKASCTQTGETGNDYLPGLLCKISDPLPYPVTCRNIDMSSGGRDSENDEAYRERIAIAPESFSCAGSVEGYEYFARSADNNVQDVAVIGPAESDSVQPGNINIYPLMAGGNIPTQEELALIQNTVADNSVRVDTDFVHVLPPEKIPFSLKVEWWLPEKNASFLASVTAEVENAAGSWCTWQKAKLGRDINPSNLISRIIQAGAQRCEVSSPPFTEVKAWQFGFAEDISITYRGLASA